MKMDKSITLGDCYKLIDKWFNDFICKWSGIGLPMYDIWLADIGVHTLDEEMDNKILEKIANDYLPEERRDDFILCFDGGTPLIMLASYVLWYGKDSNDQKSIS